MEVSAFSQTYQLRDAVGSINKAPQSRRLFHKMEKWNTSVLRNVSIILFLTAMAVVAEVTNQREIIILKREHCV